MARPNTGQTKVLGIRLTLEEMDRYDTISGGRLTEWARKQLEAGAVAALETEAGTAEDLQPRELAWRLHQRFEDGVAVGRSLERLWLVFEQGREDSLDTGYLWQWALDPANGVAWEAIRRAFLDGPFRDRFIRWWAGPTPPSGAAAPDNVATPP